MKTKSATRRAMLLSLTSLLICAAMLIGTTYAWFTDSVTSGTNRIIAGNLDVELLHENALTDANATDEQKAVDTDTELFNAPAAGTAILWEPGAVTYEKLTVKNVGTLALKYQLNFINFEKNNVVAGGVDTGRSLLDVIRVQIDPNGDVPTSRPSFNPADPTLGAFASAGAQTQIGTLEPQASESFTVVLYWPSDTEGTNVVDNDYNLKNGAYASNSNANDVGQLYVNFGAQLIATQQTSESDSFDNLYDETADGTSAWSGNPTAPAVSTISAVNFTNNAIAETKLAISNVAVTTVPAATTLKYTKDNAEEVTITAENSDETSLKLTVEETETAATFVMTNTANETTSYEVTLEAVTENGNYKVNSTNNAIITDLYIGVVDLAQFAHNNVAMTSVGSKADVDADGEYYYDQSTGYITMATTSFSPFTAEYKFAGGIGTERHPYQLETAAHWEAMYKEFVNERTEDIYFALAKNIDFTGMTIDNYASSTVYDYNICHLVLDGQGYTLNNICGFKGFKQLFPYIYESTIKNITINYNMDSTKTLATAYNASNVTFDHVTVTGTLKTTADWASAFVAYPFDKSGYINYYNCVNYANLRTNLSSNSYVAPFGSHTMSIGQINFKDCENHGNVEGGHTSAFVGMTGGNTSRYTINGTLTNYGKIRYSIANGGGLFTFGSHALNANVVAGEGSSVEQLEAVAAEIQNGKLVINDVDPDAEYKVKMSVSVQMYNYNSSGNWSGAFPRDLVKTYSGSSATNGTLVTDFEAVPVLENFGSRTGYGMSGESVDYHGIFAPENFSINDEGVNVIVSDENSIITLVSYQDKVFYYLFDSEWPQWYGLVTTSNGAEDGNLKGTISVQFAVEKVGTDDSKNLSYSFSIPEAAAMLSGT